MEKVTIVFLFSESGAALLGAPPTALSNLLPVGCVLLSPMALPVKVEILLWRRGISSSTAMLLNVGELERLARPHPGDGTNCPVTCFSLSTSRLLEVLTSLSSLHVETIHTI